MIIVYGADWCEDTRRALRHLRRLAVAHQYVDVDEDAGGLARTKAFNGGERRTPTVDLGLGGPPLVKPDNDRLSEALVELQMLTQDDVHERMTVQNVGDLERGLRALAGAAALLAASAAPRGARWPLQLLGAVGLFTGLTGWCPAYHAARVSSLDGPGDRRREATRSSWLIHV